MLSATLVPNTDLMELVLFSGLQSVITIDQVIDIKDLIYICITCGLYPTSNRRFNANPYVNLILIQSDLKNVCGFGNRGVVFSVYD